MKGIIAIIIVAAASYFIFFKKDSFPKECEEMMTELSALVDIMREDNEFSRGLKGGLLRDRASKFDQMSNVEFLDGMKNAIKEEYKKTPDKTTANCKKTKAALIKARDTSSNFR